jgi:ketol-acid reductoisomerase
MANIYYDKDAKLPLIRGKNVAIIGYGSQGHAHALNLKESGVDVRVGLAPTSKSRAKAKKAGLKVGTVDAVSKWADVIMVLVPDTTQASLYKESIAPNLTAGKMLMFAHGFNIRFGTIKPPRDVDVAMVAPKGPGHRVREVFVEGVVPMHYKTDAAKGNLEAPDRFLKELGASAGEPQPKLSLNRASVPTETKAILLDYKRSS